MDDLLSGSELLGPTAGYDQRMAFIVDTMREMSGITDPQQLVRAYSARMRKVMAIDGMVSLSRRNLSAPWYYVTRSSIWDPPVNPWNEKEKLPLLDRGLFGRLIYGDQPVIIDELQIDPDDPALSYFDGMRSLVAIPLYEAGEGLNMVVLMRRAPFGFPHERLPAQVWMSNLFGRATNTLVLSNEVKKAYDAVERELKAVADIQRSLLPAELPKIDTLDLAVHYQTSLHSGGDYYDFFKLPDGQWGILIADVSGHGTPAAVLMAITHSIAHIACDPPAPPARLLHAINSRLTTSYSNHGNFVTAFYGVYDCGSRKLTWSNAGHPPPRLRRKDGTIEPLPFAKSLPLGIEPGETFGERETQLSPGELLLFYTDGITEARNRSADLFGEERLDAALQGAAPGAEPAIQSILAAVEAYAQGRCADDDRTLLAASVK